MRPVCWPADQGLTVTACDGQLIRAHLIPKQRIRRELRAGRTVAELREIMWDSRAWVWCCGGPTGSGGHHGQIDYSRTIRILRAQLPPELEAFAEQYGLEWSLEHDYGPRKTVEHG